MRVFLKGRPRRFRPGQSRLNVLFLQVRRGPVSRGRNPAASQGIFNQQEASCCGEKTLYYGARLRSRNN
jgi:hypothetical protein